MLLRVCLCFSMSRTRCHRHICVSSAAVCCLDCLAFSVEAPIDPLGRMCLLLTSVCVGAAKKDDLQEKITSSGREQIESFIGAVSEKITPPAPAARSGPASQFAPRQVSAIYSTTSHSPGFGRTP